MESVFTSFPSDSDLFVSLRKQALGKIFIDQDIFTGSWQAGWSLPSLI